MCYYGGIMDSPEQKSRKNEEYKKISPTAWGVAYRRTLANIPYSQEIFDELQEIVQRTRTPEEIEALQYPEITPMFEARYKLTNQVLKENKTNQILEIAAGFSPRGIEMAKDPTLQYVELDLPGVAYEKRAILEKLIAQAKISQLPNLHIEEGSALEMSDLERAVQSFKQEPLNVVNEGLLRYLSVEERTKLAKHVHALLERFGGAWITPDISIQTDSFEQLNDRMKEQNARVERLTGLDFSKNRFASEDAARSFFEDLGFEVEQHSFMEVSQELISPQKLNLSFGEVQKMIGRVAFVMRLKS